MELGLATKVALVGGASRGIGLAIGKRLADEGAHVALVARDAEALEKAKQQIADATGSGRLVTVAADLTLENEVERAVATAEAALGPLEIVIANAGSGSAQAGYKIGAEEWKRVLDTNLLTATLLAGHVLPRLCARRTGSLTVIGSIAGLEAIGAPVPYAAAKAALHMAVKAYARQAGPQGVRVNAVAPGNILFPGGNWEAKLTARREHFEAIIQREVALGRFGTPDEIADIVAFLASERARFVTGAIWVADGGQTRGLS